MRSPKIPRDGRLPAAEQSSKPCRSARRIVEKDVLRLPDGNGYVCVFTALPRPSMLLQPRLFLRFADVAT